MKPEFTIEQIRQFVDKGYTSVSARYVKAMLQHYDEKMAEVMPSDEKTTKMTCPQCNKEISLSDAISGACGNCGWVLD